MNQDWNVKRKLTGHEYLNTRFYQYLQICCEFDVAVVFYFLFANQIWNKLQIKISDTVTCRKTVTLD